MGTGVVLAMTSVASLVARSGFNLRSAIALGGTVVVVPAGTLHLIFRSHRRRRDAAAASGAWGSSSSVQVDDLMEIPRFAGGLGEVRKMKVTKGWVGGGVTVDDRGITWTPTHDSQRRRRVPVLFAPWTDIVSTRRRSVPGVGDPGILEVAFADGSQWAMNIQGVSRLGPVLKRFAGE